MKVAITGVAGFIGSNLAERLHREGHDVVGLDNLAYAPRTQVPLSVDFRLIDIRDSAVSRHLRGCDVVFHLAAKNCIADCQDDPVETSAVNVTGTVNILKATVDAGVGRFIYAESSALYEGSTSYPTPETDVAPRSFYAVSKAAGMLFADAYARFHDVRTTALRYFCVYGPRQDYRRTTPPVMSAFILKLLRGEKPVIFGDGTKRRDFVYVDDVNDFHVLCLRDDRTVGNVYNVGSGTNHSIREIYDNVAALLDSSIAPEFRSDLPGEAEQNLADVSKAMALGWTARTPLKDGLRESIAFIREHVLPGRDVESASAATPRLRS